MTNAPPDRIRRDRELLQNPYAHLSDDGGYEATLPLRVQSGASPEQIRRDRERRLNQYAHVSDEGYEATVSSPDANRPGTVALRIDASALLGGKKQGDRFSWPEIDDVAWQLQAVLWKQRPRHVSVSPLDVIDPVVALNRLGFEVTFDDALLGEVEVDGEILAAAGVLDRDNALVRISPRYSAENQRFTLAHELGHVLLHPGSGLHRDRALDGASSHRRLPLQELEADHFAAVFLMPERIVREEFKRRFHTDCFVLDESARFGLGEGGSSRGRSRHATDPDLARRLVRATHYHGSYFRSLAEVFRVSEGAMAIRLEELRLLDG